MTWQAFGGDRFDSNAFIFSLNNNEDTPLKMKKVDSNKAIYCSSSFGSIFGGSFVKDGAAVLNGDICIVGNSNSMDSYSHLGYSYKHPIYEMGTKETRSFLSGSYRFQIDEIEVYQKE